jgi:arylsulfatase
MMGDRRPSIDRLAHEGASFTNYYAQQSCTAGRAAFITGQSPIRTGLTKVGLPGSPIGLLKQDPTIAELLKPLGYMTFQNGKNHLGDRNEFLPTVHGFDEFFGNLYHLSSEEEPENVDYPQSPEFRARFGPRGMLKCKASASDNPASDPRFGPWGKQTCEDTGPLSKNGDSRRRSQPVGISWTLADRLRQSRRHSSSGTTRHACISGRPALWVYSETALTSVVSE